MTLTHFEVTIALLVGILTMLSILAAGIRWIYRQGVSSARMVNAVNANTKATTDLSDTFKVYTEKADGTLLDHEKRLTRVEERQDRHR